TPLSRPHVLFKRAPPQRRHRPFGDQRVDDVATRLPGQAKEIIDRLRRQQGKVARDHQDRAVTLNDAQALLETLDHRRTTGRPVDLLPGGKIDGYQIGRACDRDVGHLFGSQQRLEDVLDHRPAKEADRRLGAALTPAHERLSTGCPCKYQRLGHRRDLHLVSKGHSVKGYPYRIACNKRWSIMRLAVRGAWIADNLRRLRSGAIYHLAYPTHQIDPHVRELLPQGASTQGTFARYVVRDGRGVHVPDGEIVAVHWFPQLIRIHFMIGRLSVDELGDVLDWRDSYCLVRGGGPTTILV